MVNLPSLLIQKVVNIHADPESVSLSFACTSSILVQIDCHAVPIISSSNYV